MHSKVVADGQWISLRRISLDQKQLLSYDVFCVKAELLQVGIFFALNFLPLEFLMIKKLEIFISELAL